MIAGIGVTGVDASAVKRRLPPDFPPFPDFSAAARARKTPEMLAADLKRVEEIRQHLTKEISQAEGMRQAAERERDRTLATMRADLGVSSRAELTALEQALEAEIDACVAELNLAA